MPRKTAAWAQLGAIHRLYQEAARLSNAQQPGQNANNPLPLFDVALRFGQQRHGRGNQLLLRQAERKLVQDHLAHLRFNILNVVEGVQHGTLDIGDVVDSNQWFGRARGERRTMQDIGSQHGNVH